MRNKLLIFLRRYPLLYSLIKKIYWQIKSLGARFWGTKIQEKKWLNRISPEIQKDFENLDHSHREFLIKEIGNLYPFSDVLEIGCNYGPNLYLLAKRFPQVNFQGIDINILSIKQGKQWLNKKNISNVKLYTGKADNLSQFPDKSFDIIFTDAILIYIGPDKIKKAIKEAIRVARKTIVFLEWYNAFDRGSMGLGDYHFGYWKRNYINLLKQFVPENQIFLTKLPKEKWQAKDWQEFGYLIEVHL